LDQTAKPGAPILRGGDVVAIEERCEARTHMRERALATHVIARLTEHPDRCFAGHDAWNAHLEALGVSALKVNPAPVVVATEAALWGSVKAALPTSRDLFLSAKHLLFAVRNAVVTPPLTSAHPNLRVDAFAGDEPWG
jgi:hypothetical protein